MTEPVQLDTHYDCTASHHIAELRGPDHLASLMPGTVILINGWEHMRLFRDLGWITVGGGRKSHDHMWKLINRAKDKGRKVSLIHVGAA